MQGPLRGRAGAPRLILVGLYGVPVVGAALVLVVVHLWQLAVALILVEGTIAAVTTVASLRPATARRAAGRGPDASPSRPAAPGSDPRPRAARLWVVVGIMLAILGTIALLATLAPRLG